MMPDESVGSAYRVQIAMSSQGFSSQLMAIEMQSVDGKGVLVSTGDCGSSAGSSCRRGGNGGGSLGLADRMDGRVKESKFGSNFYHDPSSGDLHGQTPSYSSQSAT